MREGKSACMSKTFRSRCRKLIRSALSLQGRYLIEMWTDFKIVKLLPYVKNKFFLTALVFAVWVSLIDENNLIERFQLNKELRQIDRDKEYYREKIEIDAARLKELQTNNDNLEKFAREQYLMQRANEDVFIIVEE